ncbi:hypothetical protein BASA61_007345 [Batrachochytrium salamandrivorans]|nr:hypothetical protein BASA60_011485 [Batrachochytrium salamandrivorans]KAH6562755.1 hypothetical protein BASA62_008948 [Batrachochytrium salamandrivorans]KAH6584600.1 hypothetical protein BASA61_007345 [Batrachochytrium salamandrivorans]
MASHIGGGLLLAPSYKGHGYISCYYGRRLAEGQATLRWSLATTNSNCSWIYTSSNSRMNSRITSRMNSRITSRMNNNSGSLQALLQLRSMTYSKSNHNHHDNNHNYSNRVPILRPTLFVIGFLAVIVPVTVYSDAYSRWTSIQAMQQAMDRNALHAFGLQSGIPWLLGGKPDEAPPTPIGAIYKPEATSVISRYTPSIIQNLYTILVRRYNQLTPAETNTWMLISLNLATFLAWRLPPLASFMNNYFVHHSAGTRSFTMITSAFSQKSLLHLAFNMFAFNSFFLAMQQIHPMSPQKAACFYLSTAALASYGSHVVMRMFPLTGARSSLGSSGVVWAVVAFVTYQRPDSQAGILFLPGVALPLSDLVSGFLLLDIVGLALRWRSFDHAAHLTGALAGFMYARYGVDVWNDSVRYLLRRWVIQQNAQKEKDNRNK